MALKLLTGCGMIRKSEKRRLLGLEALGTKAAELGLSSSHNCPYAVLLVEFPGRRNVYLGYPLTEKLCYRD